MDQKKKKTKLLKSLPPLTISLRKLSLLKALKKLKPK